MEICASNGSQAHLTCVLGCVRGGHAPCTPASFCFLSLPSSTYLQQSWWRPGTRNWPWRSLQRQGSALLQLWVSGGMPGGKYHAHQGSLPIEATLAQCLCTSWCGMAGNAGPHVFSLGLLLSYHQ
eukprot:scaffold208487_cov22-Tisochrysis_lutea.AAC.1